MPSSDFWLAPHYVGWLLQGFWVTIQLSLIVSFAATVLGFLVCIARLSSFAWLAWPVRAYLSLFRNTPLLVQLFFWYFGASALMPPELVQWLNTQHVLQLVLFDVQWPSFEMLAAFVGLTLYTTAFVAEEFRSGVRAVRKGQWAAAASLGMSSMQVWRYVVMPQALRNTFPSLIGQYMNVIKNTSLTMAIGLAELSYASRQVETETFKTFQSFGIATLLYVLLVMLVEVGGQWLQRHRLQVRGGL
ncbi:amino acid ABC transporter permease [Alcaligenes ammonioxydans]|uniref:amino acid ABC transporter permease n=1 Tax=Alcaligenes TaxID=507 RepID=UPI000269E551|nr:amino acid ABC transporter permease [Alcaligenes ammonioxydans]EJC65917.1 putative amino acid permease [Alcaligenes faecalis subsp. faecalis NCIB 8687]QBH20956.1 amino acid ABC transporter permease [Alcaligenes faecalis]MCH1878685.1 amino acid ABC transporter permease [Alcaligenes ammonioxydans]WGQ37075.1 amino acid ABC transporter permease [Alcaligenes faecalis]HRK86418.1 amino acid ABC transporter permease [Alcaligenes faecalis]